MTNPITWREENASLMAKTQKFEQVAYLYIKDQIINQQWAVKHHIIESDISDKLMMSRSPIRSALDVLEKEGLIIARPYRGYFVKTIPDEKHLLPLRIRYALILWYRLLDRMVKHEADGRIIKNPLESHTKKLKQAFEDGEEEYFYHQLLEILALMLRLAQQPFLEDECLKATQTLIEAIKQALKEGPNAFKASQIWIYMYVENITHLISHNRFNDSRVLSEMLIRNAIEWLPPQVHDEFYKFNSYELR